MEGNMDEPRPYGDGTLLFINWQAVQTAEIRVLVQQLLGKPLSSLLL